jgi:hypothetical protein
LSVEDLKGQLNINGAADDAVLTRLLAAATKHTERQLGFTLASMEGGAPADLEHAVYMLGAHWYENREASIAANGVTPQAVPFGYAEIIAEHRNYTFAAADDE